MPDRSEAAATRLDEWRRKLIDLSYRNRLINYKPTRASTLEFASPSLNVLLEDPERKLPWRFYFPPETVSHVEDDDRASLFDELVVRAAATAREPERDEIVASNETDPKRLNRILENLARKSNAEYQDKSLRVLYVAAGFLDWTDPSRGEPLSSPLILVPVELRRMSASEPYQLFFVEDEEITINPSLTEKLRRDLNRDIPEDWVWEDKPVEVELQEIEAAIAETDWRVRREAVLGLFSFQKFVMYRDLLVNEAQIAGHPLIAALARNQPVLGPEGMEAAIPEVSELDDVQPPDQDMSILDADATQRRCLEAARRGQSFVMHGPPGTGKSQTIANLIADAIGRGKRVLFVSEKAAALDVVHQRLVQRGLDEFCLLLHGARAGRREVVEGLNRSLTSELLPRESMNGDALTRLGQLRELLNQTAELIHLPLPILGNRSLRDVLGELARVHDAPSVPGAPEATLDGGDVVISELRQLEDIFERLAERWNVSPKNFAWRGYKRPAFTTEDRADALECARSFKGAATSLRQVQERITVTFGLDVASTFVAGQALQVLLEHAARAPSLEPRWLDPGGARRIRQTVTEAREAHTRLTAAREEVRRDFPDRALEDLDPAAGARFEACLAAVGARIGRTAAWESELIPAMASQRRFLQSSDQLLAEVEASATALASRLGQPSNPISRSDAERLVALGELAFSTFDRPEREWLLPAGAQRAEQALSEITPKLERYAAHRNKLLETYTEEAFDLDARELHRRFTTDYTSFLSHLGGRYRADARVIKATRHNGKLPTEPAADLAMIEEVQQISKDLTEKADRLSVALGSYYKGVDTDLGATTRAIATAHRARELSVRNTDISQLGDALDVASPADPALADLANRVRSGVSELSVGLDLIAPFAANAAALFDDASLGDLRVTLIGLLAELTDLQQMIEAATTGSAATTSLSVIADRLERVSIGQAATRMVRATEPEWVAVLGSHYAGSSSDWSQLEEDADWVERLFVLVNDSQLADQFAELVVTRARPPVQDLSAGLDAYQRALSAFDAVFDDARQQELAHELTAVMLEGAESFGSELISNVDDLHDWVEFRTAHDRARSHGWEGFVEALIERAVGASDVRGAFRRAYWNRRLEALFSQDPDLADRGSTYMRWIDEFKTLDRRLIQTAPDRVIAAINRNRGVSIALPGSQTALLRREGAKQRRHMPVRKLLASLPTLLGELKPCLMMSPLSVSHFLTATHEFDVVIFDEASQVPPQDAINCIYRGKQLIVAGDSRQLPPTSFFQVAEAETEWNEDEETDALTDMESILDVCTTILPEHPLRWHYRSRNEDLIAFSNHHIYDNLLVTFPAADAASSSKGVHFIHVPDGIYERGHGKGYNKREAQVVAERVFEHLASGRRSIGVITFNASQEAAIEDELNLLRFQRPEFEDRFAGDRLDNVFVKNLESVQGDERDIILFSVGYGFDREGKFLMNFGPLNFEGGHRRLNVAVTRARELVEVISSVRSTDFRLTENSRRGARLLYEYVRYAETDGASGASDLATNRVAPAAIEETIADVTEELGFIPNFSVGTGSFRVDIGLRTNDINAPYQLAIATDGESYRRIPTARDRERLRDKVLTDLNWRVHRIWSLDWVQNRQSEINRLEEALSENHSSSTQERDNATPQHRRIEREVAGLLEALEAGALPWVSTYKCSKVRARNSGYEFHESVNRDAQRDLVIQIAEVEAPIHVDPAMQRLAAAYGLQRVGDRIRSAALQAIKMAARSGAIEVRDEFIWLPDQKLTHVRQPDWNDDATSRSIAHIPVEEVDLAIDNLKNMAGGSYDNLLVDSARVLGFDRVGPRIRTVIESRIQARAQR
jgi:hypothetical protein